MRFAISALSLHRKELKTFGDLIRKEYGDQETALRDRVQEKLIYFSVGIFVAAGLVLAPLGGLAVVPIIVAVVTRASTAVSVCGAVAAFSAVGADSSACKDMNEVRKSNGKRTEVGERKLPFSYRKKTLLDLC